MKEIINKYLVNKITRILVNKFKLNEEKVEFIEKLINLSIINIFLIFIIMFNKIHILNVGIMLFYTIYIIKMDSEDVLLNTIIFFLTASFLIENFWYSTHITINTYAFYLKPILILIILFNILKERKKYTILIKDPVVLLCILLFLINLLRIFLGGYNINDFINGFYTYFIIFIFYIFAAINKFQYKYIYISLLVVQLPLVLFELLIYKDQDQITGIFGLHATNWSMLILSISIYYIFGMYMQKQLKAKSFILILIYTFTIFMINETKMAFFIIPLSLLILILFNKESLKKKIKIISFIIITSLICMIGIVKIYPSFENILFNPKMIVDYVFNKHSGFYQYSRYENLVFTNDVFLPETIDKFIGIGQGSAIPDRELSLDLYNRGRYFTDTPNSSKYNIYKLWGYHQSSLNTMFVEIGILGISIYLLIIIFMIIKSRRIYLISTDSRDKALALAYILYVIGWIFEFWYTDVFYIVNSNMFFWLFSGIIHMKYSKLKSITQ